MNDEKLRSCYVECIRWFAKEGAYSDNRLLLTLIGILKGWDWEKDLEREKQRAGLYKTGKLSPPVQSDLFDIDSTWITPQQFSKLYPEISTSIVHTVVNDEAAKGFAKKNKNGKWYLDADKLLRYLANCHHHPMARIKAERLLHKQQAHLLKC